MPESLISKNSSINREDDAICAIFEGLVELNESGEVIPCLSQGWMISDDGLEYTFKLKEDAMWSSGEIITSFDFIDYFKYILSPDNSGDSLEELYVIEGVSDYKNGICSFENVKIQAIDNRTIFIKLNNADDNFLKKISKPMYRLRDTNEPLNDYKNQYANIRYTGAYKIESISNNEILLKANTYYEDGVNGIEKIKIKVRDSLESDFASYNLGEIDILWNPPIMSLNEGNLLSNIKFSSSNIVKTLIFNIESDIICDTRFREGLFNALYLEVLDSYMLSKNIGTWCFNEIEYNDLLQQKVDLNEYYDESKRIRLKENAKELLGKLDTRKKVISLVAENTSENKLICEFVADTLKENYNILSKITLLDKEKLDNYLEEKNFDIYIEDLNIENLKLRGEWDVTNLKYVTEEKYSIVSLYYKNSIWCKSNKIKYLYIDGNGNLIIKYTKR